jgi:hypothetical protein
MTTVRPLRRLHDEAVGQATSVAVVRKWGGLDLSRLRAFNDLSYEEVARSTGSNRGAARVRVPRCLRPFSNLAGPPAWLAAMSVVA